MARAFGVALQKHPLHMSRFVASMCMCVNVYKLRHGHLNTACLPTAVLSNSLKVCVHKWVCCREPRGQTVAAENKNVCQCVSKQTNLTHKTAIDEGLRHLSSTDWFSNSLKGCLQEIFIKDTGDSGLEHLAFRQSVHSGSLSWICKKCAEFAFLSYCGRAFPDTSCHIFDCVTASTPLSNDGQVWSVACAANHNLLKRPPMIKLGLEGQAHWRKSQSVESGKSISEGSKVSTSVER